MKVIIEINQHLNVINDEMNDKAVGLQYIKAGEPFVTVWVDVDDLKLALKKLTAK